MKIPALSRIAGFLSIIGVMALAIPSAQGHPCERDPGHKHCTSEPPPNERIPGTAVFNGSGPILGDGGNYVEGEPTTNNQDSQTTMQVALNCSFNHFNIYPGGGARRIFINFIGASSSLDTGIDSCKDGSGTPLTITVDDTTMADDEATGCANSSPSAFSGLNFAFDQLMRTTPSAGKNVCDLLATESSTAILRLQTNLYHLTDCKGGKKKCGTSLEALEINFDGSDCDGNFSDTVTIACSLDDGSQCTEWSVTTNGSGVGCLTSDNQGSQSMTLPFDVTFTPLP